MSLKELAERVEREGQIVYHSPKLGVEIVIARDNVFPVTDKVVFHLREMRELLGQPEDTIRQVYEAKLAFKKYTSKKPPARKFSTKEEPKRPLPPVFKSQVLVPESERVKSRDQLAFEFLKDGTEPKALRSFCALNGGIDKVKEMAKRWEEKIGE